MKTRTLALTLLGIGIWLGVLAAPLKEDLDLSFRAPRGSVWSVEQNLAVHQDVKGGAAVVVPIVTARVSEDISFELRYHDEVLEASNGQAFSIRRTYESVRGNSRRLPLEGAVLQLEADGDSVKVTTEKGDPPRSVTRDLGEAPLDPIVLLLPRRTVRVGDSWPISADTVVRFRKLAIAGLNGFVTTQVKQRALGVEVEVEDADTTMEASEPEELLPAWLHPALKATVASMDGSIVTLRYAGEAEAANEGSVTIGDLKVGGKPEIKARINATLKFNLAEKRPVSLDWQEKWVEKSAGGILGRQGNIGGVSEVVTQRILTRSYRKTQG